MNSGMTVTGKKELAPKEGKEKQKEIRHKILEGRMKLVYSGCVSCKAGLGLMRGRMHAN